MILLYWGLTPKPSKADNFSTLFLDRIENGEFFLPLGNTI